MKATAHAVSHVFNDARPADEVLQGLQAEKGSSKLVDSLFFGGSKPSGLPTRQHPSKQSPKDRPRDSQQHQPSKATPRGTTISSSHLESISAASTASIAARAQLQQGLHMPQALPAASASFSAGGGRTHLPLHKFNLGAEYAQDLPGPEDWTIPTATSVIPTTAAVKSSKASAAAAGAAYDSSKVPLPGQLPAAAAAAAAGPTAAANRVPEDCKAAPAMHQNALLLPAAVPAAKQAPSPGVPEQNPQQLDAIIAEGYQMVDDAADSRKADYLRGSITSSITAPTAADVVAAAASDAVATVHVQQQAQGKSAAVPAAAAATTTSVLGFTGTVTKTKTTQIFTPGQVIQYQVRVPGEAATGGNSSSQHLVLELELLGCYGVGTGELYHVRLLSDAALPASAVEQQQKKNLGQAHAGGSDPAVANSSTGAKSIAERMQYKAGQEFALKLRDRELPMTVEGVSVLRKLMRKESCLRYAKQLKASSRQ